MSGGPCYGCTVRFDGCHGQDESGCWRCAAYQAFREQIAAMNAAKAKAIAADNDTWTVYRTHLRRRRKNDE